MWFNSFEFLIFLPTVLILYLPLPKRGRGVMLVVASYAFYSYGNPYYTLLLMASTVIDYFVGLLLYRTVNKHKRRAFLVISLAANLGFLGFFKYGDFAIFNLNRLSKLLSLGFHADLMGFVLPVGISFYTFQSMSYILDVYRGRLKPEENFINYSLFVSFFPQLVAGPIERAGHLIPQLKKSKKPTYEDFYIGTRLIFWGLLEKLVFADRFGLYTDSVYGSLETATPGALWLATYCFAFQIYFDFAGYSHIAIGAARYFHVDIMNNFNRPYMSTNISEFWRRWHISLSTWLRDYLYIELGGSKEGMSRTVLNLFIVMFLGGLWHGAAFHFVAWGLYHGILLGLYHLWKPVKERIVEASILLQKTFSASIIRMPTKLIAGFITFNAVCIGWVFFRAPGAFKAAEILRRMFSFELFTFPTPYYVPLFFMGLVVLCLMFEAILEKLDLGKILERASPVVQGAIYSLVVLVIVFGSVEQSARFIYFQF